MAHYPPELYLCDGCSDQLYVESTTTCAPIRRQENKQIPLLLCMGHNLEKSRPLVKMNGTIEFLDHENTGLDTKILILSG